EKIKLSDLGIIVKDFVVSSVEFTDNHEEIGGVAGGVDNGVSIGRRSISVPIVFKSVDLLDYPLLRDKLFDIFYPSGYLYIQELRRPKNLAYKFVDFGQKAEYEDGTDNVLVGGKRYKVRIADSFNFEQFKTYGKAELNFVTVGLPFAESIYTTKELNNTGYSALVEKYGLVDNIHEAYQKYVFYSNVFDVWNGGNVVVEPESMYLKIIVKGTNGNIKIKNKTTNQIFEVNSEFGGTLEVDGVNVK